MSDVLFELWAQARGAFRQERTWARARTLGMALLCGLGRHTLTGLLVASGQQNEDWSAAYRLFEQERLDLDELFAPVVHGVIAALAAGAPVVGFLDDTLVRKRGKHVAGARWRRDPLGPPFQTNLVWGQRFVQSALALPDPQEPGRVRAVPVRLTHAPTPSRPGPQAPPEAWEQYRAQQRQCCLSAVGAEALRRLRETLDAAPGGASRHLRAAVDGSYTNRTVFRNVPARTTLIGRVRKDAALFAVPPAAEGRGRPRTYGAPLPTPEQLRQDPEIPWQAVRVYGAGAWHTFEIKAIGPVRWRGAGEKNLLLVIVRPLAYRPRKGSRLLYRQPAYLLCSDPTLDLAQLLQVYVWRWEVEVTFREEKTLLGMGEAQVRTEPAAAQVPAFAAVNYAYLQLAAWHTERSRPQLARPKWQRPHPGERPTTSQLQGLLRAELWGDSLGVNIRGFLEAPAAHAKPLKIGLPLAAAVIYAQG